MLDGLLGRTGFYSKCKSLIKQTRARINVLKRKRIATQKFMRKDIADLLANALQNNAYGKAEALIMDMILSACYDFIDRACEIISEHLPVLQKLRECPEGCKEAVASLMFAAARFSDLPELRELRDLFQERYGSSLEYYVNQKLADYATPKHPSMEKKVQLMQEIALEFSVQWNYRAFVERMSRPPAPVKNHQHSPGLLDAAQKKVWTPFVEGTVCSTVKGDVLAKNSSGAYQINERRVALEQQLKKGRGVALERRGMKHDQLAKDIQRSMRKRQEDVTDRPKHVPPYVKSRNSKHKSDKVSKHANDDGSVDKKDTLMSNAGSKSDKSDGLTSADGENGLGRFTEIYYRDASSGEFVPRRKLHRRRHSRSLSSQDDKGDRKTGREEENVVRRVSTSGRKNESRKDLQVLFDNEYYEEDEEERMIDRLLLHYSMKPSPFDSRKPMPKINNQVKDVLASPQHKALVLHETKANEVSTAVTSRSMSFPTRQVTEPDPKKVFVRASSFQVHSPAKHVHPKLPDYDDLAARFAALRASADSEQDTW